MYRVVLFVLCCRSNSSTSALAALPCLICSNEQNQAAEAAHFPCKEITCFKLLPLDDCIAAKGLLLLNQKGFRLLKGMLKF